MNCESELPPSQYENEWFFAPDWQQSCISLEQSQGRFLEGQLSGFIDADCLGRRDCCLDRSGAASPRGSGGRRHPWHIARS